MPDIGSLEHSESGLDLTKGHWNRKGEKDEKDKKDDGEDRYPFHEGDAPFSGPSKSHMTVTPGFSN